MQPTTHTAADLAECKAVAAAPLPATPGHELREQLAEILECSAESLHPDPQRRADA